MKSVKQRRWDSVKRALQLPALAACLVMAGAFAAFSTERIAGWQLERDVDPPSYAVAEPVTTT